MYIMAWIILILTLILSVVNFIRIFNGKELSDRIANFVVLVLKVGTILILLDYLGYL